MRSFALQRRLVSRITLLSHKSASLSTMLHKKQNYLKFVILGCLLSIPLCPTLFHPEEHFQDAQAKLEKEKPQLGSPKDSAPKSKGVSQENLA